MSGPLRVLLADDHAFYRSGVKQELNVYPEIEVVGEAKDGEEAIELTLRTLPDVVLLDITMPGCSGLEALEVIKRRCPQVRVVMLTVHEDDNNLLDAFQRGADGYLLKNLEPADLLDMLRRIKRGEPAITGRMGVKLLQQLRRSPGDPPNHTTAGEVLSDREIQVLRLIAKGQTNLEIAQTLFITENTVKMHVRNIMEKLHLQNRVQAAVYAVQEGLVEEVWMGHG